jgi:hypothetical protein
VSYLSRAAQFPYATLKSIHSDGVTDLVVIDVEPELPQRRVVDIRDHELVQIEFAADDDQAPRAYALRDDFPLQLVHTNYSSADGRCWLCLWEESWVELRGSLDPEALLERLRLWLTRTASGENHSTGQPLEPLLQTTSNTLIVPADNDAVRKPLVVAGMAEEGLGVVLRMEPSTQGGRGFEIFEIDAPVTTQRAFSQMPRTLADLEEIATDFGAPFLERLGTWLRESGRRLSEPILLLLRVPMRATPTGPVKQIELRAFTTFDDTGQVGIAMGVMLANSEGANPVLRLSPGEADPSSVRLVPWRVVRRLDRAAARALAGAMGDGEPSVLAVGAGAVGSNVVAAAARAGFARWTIVDDDVLLPHNVVRQAQDDGDVGTGKASSLARLVNERLDEPHVAQAITANILAPAGHADALRDAVATADLVLDLTASPAALRTLSATAGPSRVASLFFGPDGSDLVLLAEAQDRAVTVDEIEAQYFWACAVEPQLAGHLDAGRTDFVRYANACQDLTRPLAPWKTLTLSAIGARQIELLLKAPTSTQLGIWRLDERAAEVDRIQIPVSTVRRADLGGWRVTLTDALRSQMSAERETALPAETGGILLGTVDLERCTVHVCGTLPAPRDSRHSPMFFVRGAEGLRDEVDALRARTAGMLTYLGEWHSHPRGAPTAPGNDDELLFDHLHRIVGPVARPYCMAIAGDSGLWLRLAISESVLGEVWWAPAPGR